VSESGDAWDDSGTAGGSGLRAPTRDGPRVFVPNEETDNVGIAIEELGPGDLVDVSGGRVAVRSVIPGGHKIALVDLARGDWIFKLGHRIGEATASIKAGEHVHTHNLAVRRDRPATDGVRGPDEATAWRPPAVSTHDYFLGYRRRDGRVATRNYIGILPSVNCAATVARLAAAAASAQILGLPECHGVIALTHDLGCGMSAGTYGDELLRRTLRGYAVHPNLAGVIVVTLGCEVNQPENFLTGTAAEVAHVSIQENGGTTATVAALVDQVVAMAVGLEQLARESVPLSELTLGLQCGGSDAASAITANPTLGVASDLLVGAGGRVILGETPEIIGAEQLLRRRAVTPDIAQRIDETIAWWLDYAARNGVVVDHNPSPGNREGGITTIWEKSLGAFLKGGGSPLRDVVGYAEPVVEPGLTFMDTPGYDPVSATGMVAGGANILAFTTGRGSVFGSRPVPCLKISSTTQLYERMSGDIDFDAGSATTRTVQLDRGTELFDALVRMASGESTKSEAFGFGAEEIAPWNVGAVL
jgi:altronate hydrolase